MKFALFAAVPKGMEPLLEKEIRLLGGEGVRAVRAGVSFRGSLETAMAVCLWSRTASRLVLPLANRVIDRAEGLYEAAKEIPWEEHIPAGGTLAVDFSGTSEFIRHTRFGAQTVKDAIVDRLRDRRGERPSVRFEQPDVMVNAILDGVRIRLGLDLSGESLHRRGYRVDGAEAPLKENLAAAILMLAGWPELAREGAPFLDPMCGSGTLVIEAGWMAADIAPGLLRPWFGFTGWLGGGEGAARTWARLRREAEERQHAGLERLPPLWGCDADMAMVKAATRNAAAAGLAGKAAISHQALDAIVPPGGTPRPGLLAVNPPYGRRLGEVSAHLPLYRQLGERLRAFPGWRAAIFTAEPALAEAVGWQPRLTHELFHGALACRLDLYDVARTEMAGPLSGVGPPPVSVDGGGEDFANRLRKNLKELRRWAAREEIHCYRVYDADIPEYAVAVDLYEDLAHVQEYAPPATVDPARADLRRSQVLRHLPEVLGLPPERIFLKERRRGKGGARYGAMDREGRYFEVREGGYRFLVNFTDHLDTGLFLDHRPTRMLLGALARGHRFLNLFGYTGTATVHAVGGGATASVTVDLSATYLDWALRNLRLNHMDSSRHRLIQADAMAWLAEEKERYGLIFLDPPTFSNSKRMDRDFDLQRVQGELLRRAAHLLDRDGILIFSCNYRRFRLDEAALPDEFNLEEISKQTLPHDFRRNPRIHRCWRIQRKT